MTARHKSQEIRLLLSYFFYFGEERKINSLGRIKEKTLKKKKKR